jgi:hypothetical protein
MTTCMTNSATELWSITNNLGLSRIGTTLNYGGKEKVGSWHRVGIFGTARITMAIWWYNGPRTDRCWRTVPDPDETIAPERPLADGADCDQDRFREAYRSARLA